MGAAAAAWEANEHCQLNWASVNNFIAIITHIHNANYRNFWEMKSPFAYVLLLLVLLVVVMVVEFLPLLLLYVCISLLSISSFQFYLQFVVCVRPFENISGNGHFGIKCHTAQYVKVGI